MLWRAKPRVPRESQDTESRKPEVLQKTLHDSMLTKKNTENTIAIRKKVNLAAHKQGYKVAQPFPI